MANTEQIKLSTPKRNKSCICIYVCVCVYLYWYMDMRMHVNASLYTHMFMCIYLCWCMHMRMHVYVSVYKNMFYAHACLCIWDMKYTRSTALCEEIYSSLYWRYWGEYAMKTWIRMYGKVYENGNYWSYLTIFTNRFRCVRSCNIPFLLHNVCIYVYAIECRLSVNMPNRWFLILILIRIKDN